MTSFAAIGDDLAGQLADTTSSGFPDFPGEHPSKADVERWITVWTEDLGTSGYGAFTRGEVPYEVVKLKQLRASRLRWGMLRPVAVKMKPTPLGYFV